MGRKLIDLTGKRFGRLVCLSHPYKTSNWICVCDCGKKKVVSSSSIRKGTTQSCGCLNAELAAQRKRTHSMSGTREYETWARMISRCEKKNDKAYARYGGRGIFVCNRWRNSFGLFYKDVGPRPSNKHSLDRINNSLGYFPENCRWATKDQQANNMSTNHLITCFGKTDTISNFSKTSPVKYGTIVYRISRGWSPELAITKPARAYAH